MKDYIFLVNRGNSCTILYRVMYQANKKERHWLAGREGEKEGERERKAEGRRKMVKVKR